MDTAAHISSDDQQRLYHEFLAERHQLLGFALALVRDYQVAEDLLQDLWLQLFKSIDRGAPPQHVPAWCRRVLRNLAVDHWRSGRREQPSQHLSHLVEQAFEESAADNALDERRVALRHCLDQVPDHARKLLAMRYQEGLTSATIADRLDRKMEAVKKQITRLRNSLETCIRKQLTVGASPGHEGQS